MIRIHLLVAASFLATAAPALAETILVHDAKSQPESMAVAANGDLYVGSASTPYIYRIKKGATQALPFVDASNAGPGTFFFGQLVDNATNTLWACQLTPVPNSTPRQRHTALRGFDLTTGKQKLRWNLPGENSTCNDFAIGPDKALYITDTANARIYRLAPGAKTAQLYLESPELAGIDGITFLNGTLYVNSVSFNQIFRIPVDANGKPETPEKLVLDAPIAGPDGMRAADGKLFVAENKSGRVDAITMHHGNVAHVQVLKIGLDTPTGVEPAGDVLWITNRGAGQVLSIPMPR